MDDFERELQQGFLEEAAQLLADAEQCFLSLESNPGDESILEKIFRLAHNLKGSSKAVGFSSLGAFTHEFENLLLKLKKKELSISTPVVTLMLKCNDHLRDTIEKMRADLNAQIDHSAIQAEVVAAVQGNIAAEEEAISPEEIAALQRAEEVGAADVPSPPPASSPAAQPEALNSPSKLVEVVSPSTEAPQAAAAASTPPSAPAEAGPPPAPATPQTKAATTATDESIRVSLSRLERLLNFVGEMVILQAVLREQAYAENTSLLRKTVLQMGKVSKEIQDISMSLRMVPVKQTFMKMQRIVRDTANTLGKKVSLEMTGDETELDKTVLEAIGDPLVHLVRNAVDHGIESAEKRRAAGKPEAGTVRLSAFHKGGKLIIEVRDDGGGIDPDRLMAKAREKGILRADQKLSRDQAIQLIFHPGFSTKAEVTEVSGRGVGMDVVKTNITSLQGEIHVDTEVGKGSIFTISLPLTLAIIDGMVASLENQRFIIPLSHVHESYRPKQTDIKGVTGMGELLLLRDETLPLYRLSDLLGGTRKRDSASDGIALICRMSEEPFAVIVDDILGQQQVVIKKLGLEIQGSKCFAGSAILGDGKPALILEIGELVRNNGVSPLRTSPARRATA